MAATDHLEARDEPSAVHSYKDSMTTNAAQHQIQANVRKEIDE